MKSLHLQVVGAHLVQIVFQGAVWNHQTSKIILLKEEITKKQNRSVWTIYKYQEILYISLDIQTFSKKVFGPAKQNQNRPNKPSEGGIWMSSLQKTTPWSHKEHHRLKSDGCEFPGKGQLWRFTVLFQSHPKRKEYFPDAPCMVYLPTFNINLSQM